MTAERVAFMAAKYALDIATSDELSQFGDDMLTAGVYTDSLMELATERYPIWSEVSPFFKSALRELGFALPTEERAAQIVVRKFITDIAEGQSKPVDVLDQFYGGFYGSLQWTEKWNKLADLANCNQLVSLYWEYDLLTVHVDMGYEPGGAFGIFEAKVNQFAREWVRGTFLPELTSSRQNETVAAIAQTIFEERCFRELPILADALEEAGCSGEDILNHCRNGQEHVGSCWVVDLIIGKE